MAPEPRRFQLGPKGTVSMRDPLTGEYRWVPQEEARAALADGYEPETVQEHSSRRAEEQEIAEFGDRGGEALALGGARGLTFGLSDVALTKLGIYTPDELRKIKRQQPFTSVAGDVLGSTVGLLVPGSAVGRAAGAAGRVGARAGSGTRAALLAGKEAAVATRGAASEALWGARQLVSPMAPGARSASRAALDAALTAPVVEGRAIGVLGDLAEAGVREGLTGAAVGAGHEVSEIAMTPGEMTTGEVLDRLGRGAKSGAAVFAGLGMGMRGIGAAGRAIQKRFGRGIEEMKAAQSAHKAATAEVEGLRAAGAGSGTIAEAEARLAQVGEQLASAESNVTIQLAGRTAGLAVAYSMGGGIGLHALGVILGPRAVRYLARVVKPMNGPVGSIIKEFQTALRPEALKAATKFPLDRAMLGYVAGGATGAVGNVVRWRIGQALGRALGDGAMTKMMFPAAVEKTALLAPEAIGTKLGNWKALAEASVQDVMPDQDTLRGLDERLRFASMGALADVKEQADPVLAGAPNFASLTWDQAKDLVDIDPGRFTASMVLRAKETIPKDLVQTAVGRMSGAVEWLKSQMPAESAGKQARDQWLEKVRAVADPRSALEALGRNAMTADMVEALRVAYPEVVAQLRQVVGAEFARAKASGGKFADEQLRQLGVLLGDKAVAPKLFDPAYVARIQALHQARRGKPGPKPRPGVGQLANTMQTTMQRLQSMRSQ